MTVKTFWDKVEQTDGCWLWRAYRDKDGYGVFGIGGKNYRAHRFSWMLTRGLIPEGMCVCHTCDNPPCVHPDHLWLGDNRLNTLDRDLKGRQRPPYGERNGITKLTNEDADTIRCRVKNGEKQAQLVREYGSSPAAISNIVNYRSFNHHLAGVE